MRRFVIGTTALALLLAQLVGCTADAPTAPPPGGGGTGGGALVVSLHTNDSNPRAGGCTLVQATATLNGANVPDGTGISFSTDLGAFAQAQSNTAHVLTNDGTATALLCSINSGLAHVRASASVQNKTGSDTLPIAFQASSSSAFVTSCSPNFGSPTGGTALALTGGGFSGTPSTTQVVFSAAGVSRQALVTSVSPTQIVVVTPEFPEASSASVPVTIQILLNNGSSNPIVLSAPTCFVYSTATVGPPTVTAVLPSSGKNEGNTRVAIVGTGFAAPLQVFFGAVEATVLSISYNQIIALSPPAAGIGLPNQNQLVDVRVHEVSSGQDGILSGAFKYGPALRLISFLGSNVQPASGPFTPLTIQGEGFDAPVQVGLAGIVASVLSVSATEIVVVPGGTLNCAGASGAITVTNVNTGDTTTGLTFQYLSSAPTVSSIIPATGDVPSGGMDVVITGSNLTNVRVTFGGLILPISSGSATSITVHIPPTSAAAPTCPGSSTPGTETPVGAPVPFVVTSLTNSSCSVTSGASFQYTLPCVAAP